MSGEHIRDYSRREIISILIGVKASASAFRVLSKFISFHCISPCRLEERLPLRAPYTNLISDMKRIKMSENVRGMKLRRCC